MKGRRAGRASLKKNNKEKERGNRPSGGSLASHFGGR
jgi:hypothetical protein